MGPPGKRPEDSRLDALKAHQRAVASAPEPENESLVNALLPLVLAQAADLLSTEHMIRQGWHETNPLPGMQSTAGRVGMGAIETALAALLADRLPGGTTARRAVLPAIHGTLAGQNMSVSGYGGPDDRIRTFMRGAR